MPRLHMFVEGTTEQVFADTVLKPHLANHGVYLHKPVLVAHAKKKGRIHRGGGRRFRPVQNDIDRRLKEDASAEVRFTTMVDLYAPYCDFPGRENERLKTSVGPQMAGDIGLPAIRSKCPHFDEWVGRLERLGAG